MRARFPGVVQLGDGRLATRNLVPGARVRDEDLVTVDGVEHRTWDPSRSKLAAYVLKGAEVLPVGPGARVLYLGAGNGTTPSYVSDIVGEEGRVVAVEFSPRALRDLLRVARDRPNLDPVLGDAWQPDGYARVAGHVDVVFQDVAQRDQAGIHLRNLERFRPGWGLLTIKSRSVDVAREPREVYEEVVQRVRKAGWELVEVVELDPYETDHAVACFQRGGGGAGA